MHYEVATKAPLSMFVSDLTGRRVATLMNGRQHKPGTYDQVWKAGSEIAAGTYVLTIATGNTVLQSMKLVVTK